MGRSSVLRIVCGSRLLIKPPGGGNETPKRVRRRIGPGALHLTIRPETTICVVRSPPRMPFGDGLRSGAILQASRARAERLKALLATAASRIALGRNRPQRPTGALKDFAIDRGAGATVLAICLHRCRHSAPRRRVRQGQATSKRRRRPGSPRRRCIGHAREQARSKRGRSTIAKAVGPHDPPVQSRS